MFEKNMKFSYLIDLYGDVLDDNTREIMTAYYYDDLSLAEIAASIGISRQGVRHTIKRGEEHLGFLEEKLSLARKNMQIEKLAEDIAEVAKRLQDISPDIDELSAKLFEIEKKLINKGV